jgi:16S rRNA processing protein RimM
VVPELLHAGRVARPHGLDGSFLVAEPEPRLLAVGTPLRVGAQETEVVRRAGTDERPIVRVGLAGSREDALALRGRELLVPRAVAPALEEDEYWAEDLVGCLVVGAAGERELGRVVRLVALPSLEALELEDGRLVPLVRDAVRAVDVAARRIEVELAFLGG